MRRTCGFGRWLLASAFVVSFTLLAGLGGAAAAMSAIRAIQQPAVELTCASPDCPIAINDYASGLQDQAATPYPSSICCAGGVDSTPIDTVKVTLNGLTHESLDNVDVLLVAETLSGSTVGAVELMSDVGGSFPTPVPLDLTFDDAASGFLPQGGAPNEWGVQADELPRNA